MELFDAIYQRRAIKAFDPAHTISADDEQKLFEAAIQAPTSFNIQHWRFVVVRDKALRAEMRKLGNDQAQITDSSLLVIMTADMKAWQKNPARYWTEAPKEVADLLVGWMGPFHDGREWLQRDEAQRSIGMARLADERPMPQQVGHSHPGHRQPGNATRCRYLSISSSKTC